MNKCVQYHCDKHTVKMILESAQILSSVHHVLGTANDACYKLTHKNHPVNIWARTSLENYEYLLEFTYKLGEEYTYRYGKVHKSIREVIPNLPKPLGLDYTGFTEPAKCVHDDFKHIEDTVEAYRQFYIRDKGEFCVWTGRDIPWWFV